MRRHHLTELIRDVDVARAITPVVHKHSLSIETTTDLLNQLAVPRARSVAESVVRTP
jgi:hypothetical protein